MAYLLEVDQCPELDTTHDSVESVIEHAVKDGFHGRYTPGMTFKQLVAEFKSNGYFLSVDEGNE